MSERNRNPDPYPVLERLKQPASDNETEDVIAIEGFVGPRLEDGPLRLFADEYGQRFLEIPFDDFIDAEPIPDDERMMVYVKRQVMVDDLFDAENVLEALEAQRNGPPLSLWPFIPENRLIAAELLGMLPGQSRSYYEEESS